VSRSIPRNAFPCGYMVCALMFIFTCRPSLSRRRGDVFFFWSWEENVVKLLVEDPCGLLFPKSTSIKTMKYTVSISMVLN
jgi:hypothetical protein